MADELARRALHDSWTDSHSDQSHISKIPSDVEDCEQNCKPNDGESNTLIECISKVPSHVEDCEQHGRSNEGESYTSTKSQQNIIGPLVSNGDLPFLRGSVR